MDLDRAERLDTPLTNPRSLGSSLAFHVVLLLLTSMVVLSVVTPEDTLAPLVLHAELGPVDNRAPGEAGGGGPGEQGGVGPPVAFRLVPGTDTGARGGRDPAAEALLEEVLPPHEVPVDQTLAMPPIDTRGVGVLPGPGLGGGGGSGGGSGGGFGRGAGPSTEFFGARERAGSFAFVIDRSGSMSQHHALDVAKRELLASISQLPPDARCAVIFYNLDPTPIPDADGKPGLMAATARNKEHVRLRLADVYPIGGTGHVKAFRAGFATGAEVVFFLTDAQQMTWDDAGALQDEAGPIRVHAIEFGTGPDPSTSNPLKALATVTGGSYRYVDIIGLRPTGPEPSPRPRE